MIPLSELRSIEPKFIKVAIDDEEGEALVTKESLKNELNEANFKDLLKILLFVFVVLFPIDLIFTVPKCMERSSCESQDSTDSPVFIFLLCIEVGLHDPCSE